MFIGWKLVKLCLRRDGTLLLDHVVLVIHVQEMTVFQWKWYQHQLGELMK